MSYRLTLLLLIATPCWGQSTTTGKVETSGSCSPAVTGSNNQFTITCQGIPEKLRVQLVDLLNLVAKNQSNAAAMMAKLDECLAGVNPQIKLTKLSENVPENGRFRTQFRMEIATQRAFVLYLKVTSPSLDGTIGWERDVPPGHGGYSSFAMNAFNGPGYAEEDLQNVESGTYTVTLYTLHPGKIDVQYEKR